MKNIYIIIAIVFIFRPVMPVVEYIVNYDYIATVLCENVDKPELQCNGKCHVAKELEQVLDHDTPVKLEKATVLFDFIPVSIFEAKNYTTMISLNVEEKVSFLYANFYTFLFSTIVLQPPIL
ncbi:hypothetical protein [Myroides marinus]|nr:hypothetical protein [Myroides marinus]